MSDVRIVHVHYYNGHNVIVADKHIVKHMEMDANYVIIVAEEIKDDNILGDLEYFRYTYPRTKIIKIVEKI